MAGSLQVGRGATGILLLSALVVRIVPEQGHGHGGHEPAIGGEGREEGKDASSAASAGPCARSLFPAVVGVVGLRPTWPLLAFGAVVEHTPMSLYIDVSAAD
jgi:hypothetical protein